MPLIKFKSFPRVSLLLIALISAIYVAGSVKAGSSQTGLAYSRQSSLHSSSSLLKSPNGTTYRLSLIPELDVGKHVVVLDLVLQRVGRRNDDPNLLDSTGKLHGYQPYFFAASDFAGGAQKSIYGDLRVIDSHRLGMEMHVKVVGVNVEPTPASSSQAPGYQFDDLTLQITTQSLAGGTSEKSEQ
jgi:hypothetical protein